MRKTSVYLSEEQAAQLAQLAEQEHRSQAEIIRAALEEYRPRAQVRNFALFGCVEGDGAPFTQEDSDELMKGFGT